MGTLNRRFSVAPMMDWTDRHCRYFHRLLTKQTLLYTEMVTTGALLYNDPERFLQFNEAEHPVALQLGGSDPKALSECSQLAEQAGYDELNLNCGCPSDRVQNGSFGACLMLEPDLVADCIGAMIEACNIPVTVKCRIGVDDQDDYEGLQRFTSAMVSAGCETLIVHARKAWLKGLSPKQNREIPPLNYERVYRLKEEFPDLDVIINGGVETIDQAKEHLPKVDGVMMGRAAYQNPWQVSKVDAKLFGDSEFQKSRVDIIHELIPYIETQLGTQPGPRLSSICRHILGLFNGEPGAKRFKRTLSEKGQGTEVGVEVLKEAIAHFEETSAIAQS